jgi:hypothetical protein
MTPRKLTLAIWLPIAALAAALLGGAAGPMATAWRCYALHATGERVQTEVVGKTPDVGLLLRVTGGSQAGMHCTAETSEGHLAAAAAGDVLEVVLPEGRPGECVLVATLENSMALMTALAALLAVFVLVLVLLGLFLQRSFTRPGVPNTRFDLPPGAPACPRCRAPMAEGYLPLLAGIHWRDTGQPVGMPHALAGLPGTTGWRERARVHAFRCPSCAIVTFQYARGAQVR